MFLCMDKPVLVLKIFQLYIHSAKDSLARSYDPFLLHDGGVTSVFSIYIRGALLFLPNWILSQHIHRNVVAVCLDEWRYGLYHIYCQHVCQLVLGARI